MYKKVGFTMKENYEVIKLKDNEYKKLIEPYKDRALAALGDLIRINSVYDEETKSKKKPFGQGVEEALRYVARLGYELGFNVDRCDNYATELSYGDDGYKVLDIYAHVDVVPVNFSKWTKDPFSMIIEDDNIYGRGSCDDKGPGIACLFATKALLDARKIRHCKVRFIFGGNEERGSLCLEHYFKNMQKGYPDLGFSPDADYPLIYAEKSMASYCQVYDLNLPFAEPFDVGGALNIVLDNATITMNPFENVKEEKSFISSLKKYTKGVKGLKTSYENHILSFKGIAAHGSMPYLGVNAGLHLLHFLGTFFDIELLNFIYDSYIDGKGELLHVDYKDKVFNESTYNVGKIIYTGSELKVLVNARFPVSVTFSDVISKVMKNSKARVEILSTSEGFVFDKKSPLISILMNAYQEETGDKKSKPLAIGGGTYARESKNSVAFGPSFIGRDYRMHGDDEYFPLADFYSNMQIYCHAIDKLLTYLKGDKEDETQAQEVDR